MQQLPGLCPASFGVDDAGGPCPPGGGEAQAGQLLVAAQRMKCPAGPRWLVLARGHPLVKVGLRAGGQRETACGQPVQECHGGGDVPAGDAGLVVGGVGAADPVAQPAQDVPGRVAVQDLLLLPVGPAGDGLRDPAFELDEVLVAGGQRSGGDQDAAQVRQWFARGQFVERGMGERRRPAASSVSMVCEVALESQARTAAGRSVVASVWCRTCSSGRTLPVPSASSSSSRWRRWQRRHAPAIRRPGLPQAGQVLKKPGPGTAQSPHSGASRVPARAGASCPHREHRARDRAHAPHRGWPVTLETVQGTAVRPQLLQVRMPRGLQVAQTGPSGMRVLTCLRRRQRTQSSRLTGSLTRQYGHNGRPWPSRAAARALSRISRRGRRERGHSSCGRSSARPVACSA